MLPFFLRLCYMRSCRILIVNKHYQSYISMSRTRNHGRLQRYIPSFPAQYQQSKDFAPICEKLRIREAMVATLLAICAVKLLQHRRISGQGVVYSLLYSTMLYTTCYTLRQGLWENNNCCCARMGDHQPRTSLISAVPSSGLPHLIWDEVQFFIRTM